MPYERKIYEEIDIPSGKIRLLAGSYQSHEGFKGHHLPLDYYDIQLASGGEITLDTKEDASIMVFTLIGDISIE